MSKSTTKQRSEKPEKPHPDFPLFAHDTRRWAKKVLGKIHYFGRWEDPQGALKNWLEQKDDLLAGRKPRPKSEGLTLRDLLNHFLTAKRQIMESGELTPRSFQDYYDSCSRVADAFGKTRAVSDLHPGDFNDYRATIAKKWGPVAIGNEVQRVRSLFKYGFESGLMERPMLFGPLFKKPKRRDIRLARQAAAPKFFDADEIRKMLESARPQMKAMILLAINCGWGNTDIAMLQFKHLDLAAAMADYPRHKTAILRRSPLWPETVRAIKEATKVRPEPKADVDAGCVFITKYGERWKRVLSVQEIKGDGNPIQRRSETDSVGLEFAKLLRRVKIPRQKGVNFYALRHTFRTIASETGDLEAVERIMGHEDADDMGATYQEWRKNEREDARLKRVTDHVRAWLYGELR